jgi:hypothetical protein
MTENNVVAQAGKQRKRTHSDVLEAVAYFEANDDEDDDEALKNIQAVPITVNQFVER